MEALNPNLPQLGIAGTFILFLIWLVRYFLKENKEARSEYTTSVKEMTKGFSTSVEANTATLKQIEESMKQHETRSAERFAREYQGQASSTQRQEGRKER